MRELLQFRGVFSEQFLASHKPIKHLQVLSPLQIEVKSSCSFFIFMSEGPELNIASEVCAFFSLLLLG